MHKSLPLVPKLSFHGPKVELIVKKGLTKNLLKDPQCLLFLVIFSKCQDNKGVCHTLGLPFALKVS
jgi:hypothetical protein